MMRKINLSLLITLNLTLLTACASTPSAEPYIKILTSDKQNVHVDAWRITNADLGITPDIPWSVTKTTLRGGEQEGVDIITINNGKMKIVVIPTRGMGVHTVKSGDITLGWNSPVKQVIHPKFINLHDRGGLGWLKGFNEWMCRCGLESAGHPGEDQFINNTGDTAKMNLTLHGKIANIPASQVHVIIDKKPPYRIHVRGRVDERMFFGPKLELWADISTTPGSNTLRFDDLVTNHGHFPQEMQLIYHANYGPPILEKGSKFIAPTKRLTPFNANAAKAVATADTYLAPTPGFVEQVYCYYPLADKDGRVTVMLHNAAADKGIAMSYPISQLPYLTQWKNTAATKTGYVTGIEPGTGFPYNRKVERKFNRVPKVEPGKAKRFTLDVSILHGKDAINSTAKKIAAIQGNTKPQIDTVPPDID